jgi:outer membrane lipoprotein-sorting protein
MSDKKTSLRMISTSAVILSPPKKRRRIYRFFSHPAIRRDSLRKTMIRSTKFLFFAPLLFLGCYSTAHLKPPPEELAPERVLERAVSNQGLINSSAALISFSFKSPQESFSGDLELFFRKPDNFAFAVKALLGPDLVSGSITGDSLLLFFPRSKEYYKGKSINCTKESNSQTEFDIFCLLRFLVSETKIDPEKAHFISMDKKNYVYEESVETWKRSFWVDKEGTYLTKSVWKPLSSLSTEANENNGFLITYKNFEKFNNTKLPKTAEIKSLDEKVKLKLRFLERNMNISIPDKKFQIKIPEDAKPIYTDKTG